MTTSEHINEIAAALAKAQGEMGGAVKDSANPFFKSKYADLASVWDACRGPLAKHGLSVAQFPRTDYTGTPEIYEWTSRAGETRTGVKVVCTVSVVTRLMHSSGQWIEDVASAMLASGDPQAVGSAITYLRRYSLQSVAGVAPEDDDAEAAHGRGNGTSAVKQPQAANAQDPKGYQDWLVELEAVAQEGTPALEKAWKSSKADYRTYLTATAAPKWEALKRRAAALTTEVSA